MAETAIPDTGDPRVDAALARIRGKFTDLEDAMVIQVHLEKRMSEQMRRHAEIIAAHDAWVVEADKRNKEADKRNKETDERFRETDERIRNLVSGVGEWMRRTEDMIDKINSRLK